MHEAIPAYYLSGTKRKLQYMTVRLLSVNGGCSNSTDCLMFSSVSHGCPTSSRLCLEAVAPMVIIPTRPVCQANVGSGTGTFPQLNPPLLDKLLSNGSQID